MSKKNEYSCPPRAVATERMQVLSVLRQGAGQSCACLFSGTTAENGLSSVSPL